MGLGVVIGAALLIATAATLVRGGAELGARALVRRPDRFGRSARLLRRRAAQAAAYESGRCAATRAACYVANTREEVLRVLQRSVVSGKVSDADKSYWRCSSLRDQGCLPRKHKNAWMTPRRSKPRDTRGCGYGSPRRRSDRPRHCRQSGDCAGRRLVGSATGRGAPRQIHSCHAIWCSSLAQAATALTRLVPAQRRGRQKPGTERDTVTNSGERARPVGRGGANDVWRGTHRKLAQPPPANLSENAQMPLHGRQVAPEKANAGQEQPRNWATMDHLSRWWFAAAGCILVLLATSLVATGVFQVAAALLTRQGLLAQRLLTAIGYVVIAIAVFDVAKYILEEEVVRERELRYVSEVRRSLTRFTATVLIAVFLEAIVLIFKVAEDDISQTVYPALLLFAGVGMLLALGAFQRMAVNVERVVNEPEADDDQRKNRS